MSLKDRLKKFLEAIKRDPTLVGGAILGMGLIVFVTSLLVLVSRWNGWAGLVVGGVVLMIVGGVWISESE